MKHTLIAVLACLAGEKGGFGLRKIFGKCQEEFRQNKLITFTASKTLKACPEPLRRDGGNKVSPNGDVPHERK